jgi:hypothetical protein
MKRADPRRAAESDYCVIGSKTTLDPWLDDPGPWRSPPPETSGSARVRLSHRVRRSHGNARFRLQTPGQRPRGPKAIPYFRRLRAQTPSLPRAAPLVDPVADGALFRFPIVGLFAVGMAASALGIAQCDKPKTLQRSCAKPRYRPATSMDCKLAKGMVIFFESYERELEKYWTKTHFFQLS